MSYNIIFHENMGLIDQKCNEIIVIGSLHHFDNDLAHNLKKGYIVENEVPFF